MIDNDKYAKFKKAIAEGKQIEFKLSDDEALDGQFTDKYYPFDSEIDNFFFTPESYRIKPVIKINYWITASKNGRTILDQVEKVEDNYILTKGGLNFWGPCAEYDTIELWEPKKGERCVF